MALSRWTPCEERAGRVFYARFRLTDPPPRSGRPADGWKPWNQLTSDEKTWYIEQGLKPEAEIAYLLSRGQATPDITLDYLHSRFNDVDGT